MMMTMMGFDMIDASCFWNDSSLNYIISYIGPFEDSENSIFKFDFVDDYNGKCF